jgi:farnesyl diphosphate synthase
MANTSASEAWHTSTGVHTHPPGQSSASVTTAVARDQFEILYPMIRGFLLLQFEAHSMPQDAVEYFMRVCQHPLSLSWSCGLTRRIKCLDYNTFSGKYKTGLLVVEAAEAFKGRRLDDSEYQKAAMLGWAVVFVSPTSMPPFFFA